MNDNAAAKTKMARPRRRSVAHREREGLESFDYPADHSIGFLMRITLRHMRNAMKARLAVDGVPWSIWFYLRVLWEEDGLTQRELTKRVGMMQPTTVSALKTMERLGFVDLVRDVDDRRKLCVRLTRKGRALKARLLPDVQVLNDEVGLKGFTGTERAELQRLLLKMRWNLSEHLGSEAAGQSGRLPPGIDDE